MSLASISLVGNLAKAPERIEFSSGKVKTTLIVAVNGFVRSTGKTEKEPSPDYYRVETWGRLAELAAKYLYKGNQITVTGRLLLDHWTDKQGLSRITPVVEVSQLSLPRKSRSDGKTTASGGDDFSENLNELEDMAEDLFQGDKITA